MVSLAGSVVAWQLAPTPSHRPVARVVPGETEAPTCWLSGSASVPDSTAAWPEPTYVASTTLVPEPAVLVSRPLLVSTLNGCPDTAKPWW